MPSNHLKRLVETALTRSGVAAAARRRRRADALILAYHNIVPAEFPSGGDPGLHLPQRAFAAQLDLLRQVCDVVSLRDALTPRASDGRPRAAVTFDDAYAGAVTAGVAECVARDIPATIFVVPGMLGGRAYWWDALSRDGTAVWPDADRDAALDHCGGREEAVRTWAVQRGYAARDVPAHARSASETQLREAATARGITLGSHSWSHPNLARLETVALAEELSRPLGWLRERFNNTTDVLAYPYGLTSAAVSRAAAAAGYGAGLLVADGWWTGRGDRYAVPRLNVPAGLSLDGFALRTAGLFCR